MQLEKVERLGRILGLRQAARIVRRLMAVGDVAREIERKAREVERDG